MYDTAAHVTLAIDSMRNSASRCPTTTLRPTSRSSESSDSASPEHATLEQMTDVFCKDLKDSAAQRAGLPAILFNDAGKKGVALPWQIAMACAAVRRYPANASQSTAAGFGGFRFVSQMRRSNAAAGIRTTQRWSSLIATWARPSASTRWATTKA
jgi:hypothetical protein